MQRLVLLTLVVLAVALVSGCAKDLKLTPGGQKVQVSDKLINPDDCKLITTLRVQAQSTVRAFGTSTEQAEKDIVISARNTAAEKGANVIVPEGPPKDQMQAFKAYRCE